MLFRTFSKLRPHVWRNGIKHYSKKASTKDVDSVAVSFNNRTAELRLSSTDFAQFADGCGVAQLGDTSVMVTVVSKTKPSSSNFMPLTVDYRQKAAAAGRIPTNYHRREMAPSEHEILTSRLIDRSLRPLFPSNYYYETQIVCNLLAVDGVYDPEVLCINASSLALSLSDVPWNGPVGAVRVGMIDNEPIVNPTRREMAASPLNLIVVAMSQNLVVMLESSAQNILQPDFLKAIKVGVKECQKIVQAISQLGKAKNKGKRDYTAVEIDENLMTAVRHLSEMRLKEIFQNTTHDKLSRDEAVKNVRVDVLDKIKAEIDSINIDVASEAFGAVCKQIFRDLVLENDVRCDGRSLTDLRDISVKVDLFKPLHGTAFFQRGQTQVLCTVSLDSPNSVLQVDPISMLTSGLKEKNFFLHYEFPPYAVKEIGRMGPAVRREVGHGALAEKGIRPVIPSDYPFTIRLTSEVLQSNGSSSMASICGGSLALMDAGVPIDAAVAGVAMGLITRYDNGDPKQIGEYKILTDILGIEDYMGDMDFKIAGTKKGITALQADIKIPGLPLKIVMETVMQACDAKSKIIDIMNRVINQPRIDKKSTMPVMELIEVPPNKRGQFIGPGGINLKRLLVNHGVQVTFQDDSGKYSIFAPNLEAMEEAKEIINKLISTDREPLLEFGGVYTAKIEEIRDIGVMVTLYQGMRPALLHVSQLDQRKVSDARVLNLEVGQEMQVKYFGLDPVSGQMRLSRKVLQGPSSLGHNLQKS
ncbi:polyribonucleotide nucleotidyltransferase [Nesidiocoris tenuis]|uniref:polyribonucleotide nucleotidyltransferase n=1 Tax=Nesidiocoris tenuis TaxID=355587 RepID=A0ABN7BI65_9HEMI|nr:polyribonucleotide nucleotidyltransferase [Nesidiocoris tenuis]